MYPTAVPQALGAPSKPVYGEFILSVELYMVKRALPKAIHQLRTTSISLAPPIPETMHIHMREKEKKMKKNAIPNAPTSKTHRARPLSHPLTGKTSTKPRTGPQTSPRYPRTSWAPHHPTCPPVQQGRKSEQDEQRARIGRHGNETRAERREHRKIGPPPE